MVARLTSTISPTLLNEFVASYTTDHISFKSVGYLPASGRLSPMGYIFNNGFGGKLPAITLSGGIYDGIVHGSRTASGPRDHTIPIRPIPIATT